MHLTSGRLKSVGPSQAPQSTLEIVPADDRTLGRLEDGRVDCAFWGEPPSGPPYQARKLFREHFVGLVCANHPLAAAARRNRVSLKQYLAFPHVMVSLGNPAQSPIDIALGKQGKARHVVLTSPTFTANAAVLVGTDLIMSLPSRLLPSRLLASRLLASRLLASRLLGAFLAGDYVSFDLPFSLSEYSYWLMWHRRAANDTALTWLTSLVRAAS